MSQPLVSVVIATWNCGPYIAEALESVLAQTWQHREVLVLDDGSTDDTRARVEPFLSRIRFIPRPHQGVAATRNAGIALARGDYVALLDPDDVWQPEKLAVQLEIAARHPESGLIACDGYQFEGNTVLGPRLLAGTLAERLDRSETGEISGGFHREFIACSAISCPAQVLIPRRVFAVVGPMTELGATDYEYYLRIAQRFPLTLHRHSLARWRYRPDSMSGPAEHRYQVWDRMKVEVLELHASRCSPEERRLIARRRAELIGNLCYAAYRRGLEEGNRAEWRRELRRLLRARPWPPAALPYLLALRTPEPLRKAAVRALRIVKRARLFLAAALFGGCTTISGEVQQTAPELALIVPRGARIERIAEGFGYTEGPVWMPGGYLLFGDLPNNVIRRWDSTAGVAVVRTRSGYAGADLPPGRAMGSNGMTFDRAGRLTICEPGNRRVTRVEPDGQLRVLAEHYQGKRLNSPNDLVYRSDGSLYFTDPPIGLLGEERDPARELPFSGIYRWSDGTLQLLDTTLSRPNGLAFSPDERSLYVANADPRRKLWMRYDVFPDGTIGNGVVWLDLTAEPGQPPDGMKVDRAGNLYLTGPGGLWIVSAAGRILGRIRTPLEPSNAAWGGHDGKTLYLTAHGEVYRIRLGLEGIRPGR